MDHFPEVPERKRSVPSAFVDVVTIPSLPAHATSLIAYRQLAGGDPVEAGVSTDTTVSVVTYGPLMPGVTYTMWVEGSNSRWQGPKSNIVSYTA
jgi:hypothetical protein